MESSSVLFAAADNGCDYRGVRCDVKSTGKSPQDRGTSIHPKP